MVGSQREQPTDVTVIKELRERIGRLEQRRTSIPVLNNDPPAGSPINVWMLYDGRLRARNPNTGTVQEYVPTGSPGGTASAPQRPAPSAARQRNVGVWAATWGQSYDQTGVQAGTTGLQFGSPKQGISYRSRFGFPMTTIRSTIGSAIVQRIELLLPVQSIAVDPTVIAIGGSTVTAAPAVWSDLAVGPNGPGTVILPAEAQDYAVIDSWYGTSLMSGAINSLGIDQSLINSGASGSIMPVSSATPPLMRITYLV